MFIGWKYITWLKLVLLYLLRKYYTRVIRAFQVLLYGSSGHFQVLYTTLINLRGLHRSANLKTGQITAPKMTALVIYQWIIPPEKIYIIIERFQILLPSVLRDGFIPRSDFLHINRKWYAIKRLEIIFFQNSRKVSKDTIFHDHWWQLYKAFITSYL